MENLNIFSLQINDYDTNTDILIGTYDDLFIFQNNKLSSSGLEFFICFNYPYYTSQDLY